ncbi:MAG: hypothetical protein U0271_03545 [Polyangiaceae bacterium]
MNTEADVTISMHVIIEYVEYSVREENSVTDVFNELQSLPGMSSLTLLNYYYGHPVIPAGRAISISATGARSTLELGILKILEKHHLQKQSRFGDGPGPVGAREDDLR